MRIQIFVSGLITLSLGGLAITHLNGNDALGMLQGSLLLGGGFIICGIFTIKMPWHGIAGAGVLGLLGAARGLANVPGFARWMAGDMSRGYAPLIELACTFICAVLMLRVMWALQREKTRRLLAEKDLGTEEQA